MLAVFLRGIDFPRWVDIVAQVRAESGNVGDGRRHSGHGEVLAAHDRRHRRPLAALALVPESIPMHVHLLTLRHRESLGGFDASVLTEFSRDKEILSLCSSTSSACTTSSTCRSCFATSSLPRPSLNQRLLAVGSRTGVVGDGRWARVKAPWLEGKRDEPRSCESWRGRGVHLAAGDGLIPIGLVADVRAIRTGGCRWGPAAQEGTSATVHLDQIGDRGHCRAE